MALSQALGTRTFNRLLTVFLMRASSLLVGRQIFSSLGATNYYHHFVKNFSLIAKPSTKLTYEDLEWIRGHEQSQGFDTLKDKYGSFAILQCSNVTKSF